MTGETENTVLELLRRMRSPPDRMEQRFGRIERRLDLVEHH